jgi:hypothetical protein
VRLRVVAPCGLAIPADFVELVHVCGCGHVIPF